MKRVLLKIAYDGTNYCGWQIQPNGLAVEEVLNKKLSQLFDEDIVIIGASRTDSGVHALGNVAVFDTNTRMPAHKISYALNQRLPDSIVIQDSYEVPQDFHPRYCKSSKTYQYNIRNSKFPLPTDRLYSYFVYYPLNIDAMQEAANYLIGEHDFKSFCSNGTRVVDTVRTIQDIKILKENDIISIVISGNGFLYNMVRIIVGTLVKVGLTIYPPNYMIEILEKKDRDFAGPKAPASGLTLVKIDFPDLVKI
jgi:tRNA pseudouridine38-40 synthase